MDRKIGKKLMRLTVILLLCVFLSGCTASREIREIRRQLALDHEISMYICWPETSAAGIQVRRIVNNYNLTADVRVRLQFSKSEKEYLDEIRRLTATASLPDVFVMLDNPNDPFLRMNSKTADLAPVHQALKAAGRDAHALISGDKVDGLFLAEASMSLLLDAQPFAIQSRQDLHAFARAASALWGEDAEKRVLDFDVDDFVDRGDAADYLLLLVQNRQDFDFDAHMVETLESWKSTIALFGNEPHWSTGALETQGVLQLQHTVMNAESRQETQRVGYSYYLAAARQNTRAQEEQVAHFLGYLLQSAQELWGTAPTGLRRLKTREMPVADWELLNEELRSYAKNLISAQECAQKLKLHGEQSGWWE